MIHYIEEFEVLGSRYGIEDLDDGKPDSEHFMPESQREQGRFHLWCNGCGIGHADSRFEARTKIHRRAKAVAIAKESDAKRALEAARNAIAALDDDSSFLFRFEVRET